MKSELTTFIEQRRRGTWGGLKETPDEEDYWDKLVAIYHKHEPKVEKALTDLRGEFKKLLGIG